MGRSLRHRALCLLTSVLAATTVLAQDPTGGRSGAPAGGRGQGGGRGMELVPVALGGKRAQPVAEDDQDIGAGHGASLPQRRPFCYRLSHLKTFDRSIVDGPLQKAVWKLAWPTMLQNIIGGMQGVVDHAMVGHYVGHAGNAAIGVSIQLWILVVVFVSSVFTGMEIGRAHV